MRFVCGLALLCAATASFAGAEPLVIAHRGASAERPEHTLEAYALAIDQGADFIEPDVVATKDGVLVARHENELSATTDVASRPEFAARRTTKTVDGATVSGWFSEDFTLAELAALRAKERFPKLRGTRYDGQFRIATFQQVIDLARERRVGIYPELKHPSYFDSIGLSLEEPLVKALEAHGVRVFIQSFESSSLKQLRGMTEAPLVQLIADSGKPPDLAQIATYARGIGVAKSLVTAELIREAKRHGLLVHVWTFRPEDKDLCREIQRFLKLGIDGFFTDHVALGRAARDGTC